jgi:hypothetical protein
MALNGLFLSLVLNELYESLQHSRFVVSNLLFRYTVLVKIETIMETKVSIHIKTQFRGKIIGEKKRCVHEAKISPDSRKKKKHLNSGKV